VTRAARGIYIRVNRIAITQGLTPVPNHGRVDGIPPVEGAEADANVLLQVRKVWNHLALEQTGVKFARRSVGHLQGWDMVDTGGLIQVFAGIFT
jgi:hypothetical protein